MSLRILQRSHQPISRSPARLVWPQTRTATLFFSSSSANSAGHNNAQEIEKLNELIKVKLAEIEQAEKKRILDESKPKISDFKRPIYLTLVVASTAYLAFHWAWWHLEFEEREKELKGKLAQKEQELLLALEETGQLESQANRTGNNKKNWWKWRFWSR